MRVEEEISHTECNNISTKTMINIIQIIKQRCLWCRLWKLQVNPEKRQL